jgi:hypothetical protein
MVCENKEGEEGLLDAFSKYLGGYRAVVVPSVVEA